MKIKVKTVEIWIEKDAVCHFCGDELQERLAGSSDKYDKSYLFMTDRNKLKEYIEETNKIRRPCYWNKFGICSNCLRFIANELDQIRNG